MYLRLQWWRREICAPLSIGDCYRWTSLSDTFILAYLFVFHYFFPIRCLFCNNITIIITLSITNTIYFVKFMYLSKSILCLRNFTNKSALDTARGIVPMKVFHLVQFYTVFVVMEVIRFTRTPVRKIRALLCRLPNISSFLYDVRKSNPVAC